MNRKMSIKDGIFLLLVLSPFIVAITLEHLFFAYPPTPINPTQATLNTCLVDSCKTRRAQEHLACASAGSPAHCSALVRNEVSASNCQPSTFPPVGLSAETAIENAYIAAKSKCYQAY